MNWVITTTLILLSPFFAFADVKVGVIVPMSGEFSRYGDKIKQGLEATRPASVQYVYEDEGCNPKTAVSAFKKLSNIDGLKIVLGPWCGSPQVAVASMLSKDGSIALLGSSAPKRVFELSHGRMLSVQHSIEQESEFNAEISYSRGARRVVILFFENDFSRAHEKAYRETFKGEVLETLVYSTPDSSALKPLITRIKQLNPDLLYVPDAFPLLHGLTKQLASLGLGSVKIHSVLSAHSDDVLSSVGDSGDGIVFSYPRVEGDALIYFPRKAAELLGTALADCADANPECVLTALKKHEHFHREGVLEGELGLKTISNGEFRWVQ